KFVMTWPLRQTCMTSGKQSSAVVICPSRQRQLSPMRCSFAKGEDWLIHRFTLAGSSSERETMNQDSAQRNRHRLHFRGQLQRILAQLAAKAAHLEAAERGGGVEDVVAVDPDRAGAETIGDPVRLADVACPHCRRQTEACLVAAADHFLDVLELQHVHHRAE